MTRSRYSKKESLNRILRKLENDPITSDTPNVIPGEVLSEDAALSDLAELLEGSLPGESLLVPAAGIPFATAAQASALFGAASNVVVLSPLSHHYAHEYGGIYSISGTSAQAFPQDTWTKITGAFKGAMDNSVEVNCDWNDDRLLINEDGNYYIQYHLSWWTWSNGTPKAIVTIHNNGAIANNSRASVTFGASGTVNSLSGGSIITMTSGEAVDLRCSLSAAATVQIEDAQFTAVKMIG